jgi:hypothetical protein
MEDGLPDVEQPMKTSSLRRQMQQRMEHVEIGGDKDEP